MAVTTPNPAKARQHSAVRGAELGQRLHWLDSMRGLGMVLVVLGHSLRGVHARGLISQPSFDALDHRIYSFHMPLFFMLAGVGLPKALWAPWPQYVARRIRRLIYPLVLWTYLFLFIQYLAGAAANHPVALQDLMILPFPGHIHLWFIWALFVASMALIPARALLRDGVFPAWALVALMLSAMLVSRVSMDPAIGHFLFSAAKNGPYLVLGIVLGALWHALPTGRVCGILAGIMFLVVFAAGPLAPVNPATGFTLAVLQSLLLTYAMLCLCARVRLRWLEYAGIGSMAIYLSHTIFSAAMREVLIACGITSGMAHVVAGTAVGMLFPLLLWVVSRRYHFDRLLGF